MKLANVVPAMNYPVNELFVSLQGEASFAGTPSVFIRLQGCQVGCAFCDTKHTWPLDLNQQIDPGKILNKAEDNASFAFFSLDELINQIKHSKAKHVVFTGGEPAYYDLILITTQLNHLGYSTQIETSGTSPLLISQGTWVTLSPKINMPGGKELIPAVVQRANEIKMPIGKLEDINKLKTFLSKYQPKTKLIWLQPLSCKNNPTKLCIQEAINNNWRLSLQLHKYLSIR